MGVLLGGEFVVSCAHVVGERDEVRVVFPFGEPGEHRAKPTEPVGSVEDGSRDVALLRLVEPLPPSWSAPDVGFVPFAEPGGPSIVSGDLAVLLEDSVPARQFLDFRAARGSECGSSSRAAGSARSTTWARGPTPPARAAGSTRGSSTRSAAGTARGASTPPT
nr:trypsin-like peptidase domain-containing protein [Saccharopolyspora hordei]